MLVDPRPEMPVSSVLSPLELRIVAALQIAPRVPANALAEILGEPVPTVTRLLKKLQDDNVVRVSGRYSWPLISSGNPFQMRIRCEPGRVDEVIEGLRVFPEIQFLSTTSGSMDIWADLYPLLGSDVTDLLHSRIPGIPGIRSIQSQLVLKSPRVGQSWRFDHLPLEVAAALGPFTDPVSRPEFTSISELSDLEFKTFQLLGQNARSSAAEVSRKLGVSQSTAYRTIQTLLSTGAISPRVEVEPAALGFPLSAVLSLQVEPSAVPAVLAGLAEHPSSRMVAMVAGASSITHDGVFSGPSALADFITNDVGALPSIHAVDVSIVTRIVRRYWMDRDGVRIGRQMDNIVRRGT